MMSSRFMTLSLRTRDSPRGCIRQVLCRFGQVTDVWAFAQIISFEECLLVWRRGRVMRHLDPAGTALVRLSPSDK
jgi:hypothetical protein